VGQYQSELNRSPNKMSKGTIEKELIDGLNYVTEGTFLTLPETWLSPTAKNLQEITKNRQDNSSCQLTDRKTPSG
jgi:hypothetical protein